MSRIYVPLPKDASNEEVVRLIRDAAEAAKAARLGEAMSDTQAKGEPEGEGVELSAEEPSDLD